MRGLCSGRQLRVVLRSAHHDERAWGASKHPVEHSADEPADSPLAQRPGRWRNPRLLAFGLGRLARRRNSILTGQSVWVPLSLFFFVASASFPPLSRRPAPTGRRPGPVDFGAGALRSRFGPAETRLGDFRGVQGGQGSCLPLQSIRCARAAPCSYIPSVRGTEKEGGAPDNARGLHEQHPVSSGSNIGFQPAAAVSCQSIVMPRSPRTRRRCYRQQRT